MRLTTAEERRESWAPDAISPGRSARLQHSLDILVGDMEKHDVTCTRQLSVSQIINRLESVFNGSEDLFYTMSLHSMVSRVPQQFTHTDHAAAATLGRCEAEYSIVLGPAT